MWIYWLIASGIFFIVEIYTVGFFIFWFAIGALIAMTVSLFTNNLIIQSTVFLISSTLLLFATKPFVNKFSKNKDNIKTNVNALIGKTGLVTKKIDPIKETGQIKVNGEKWSAITKDEIKIEEGTQVIIKEIKGVKAVVSPKN